MDQSIREQLSDSKYGEAVTAAFLMPSSVQEMLSSIRTHLGMDVAFVSEFKEGRRIFRHVDSPHSNQPVKVGASDPLEDSYCQRVIDGRLPELIPDTSLVSAAMELPVTSALPVGAHLSVPIRLKNGRNYGTLCCFSFAADVSLNPRDLSMMRVFADLAAKQIDRDVGAVEQRNAMVRRIAAVFAGNDPSIVYQPIYDIATDSVVGFESLARFDSSPRRTPDIWFKEAAHVDRGIELEIKAIHKALAGFAAAPPDLYVSVNTSAHTILSGKLAEALNGNPLNRVVLEITEHASVEHYRDIARALDGLRTRGLRLAVDDAGAGYASFRHILALKPDLIKLDMSLTRDVDTDSSKRALVLAMVNFAHDTCSEIVAEGVETPAELHGLRSVGVAYAQGFLLGRPLPLASHPDTQKPDRSQTMQLRA